MAYSPTLLSHQPRRLSASPPLLTKRDKRRNAMEQRYKDLEASFASHREVHSRTQLNMLSRDISFINRADPYDNKPLEDYTDDMSAELATDSALGGLRAGALGLSDGEIRPPLGRWALKFVQDVNDTMETRDAELTEVVNRFEHKIQSLVEECDFAIAAATEEHKALKHSVRERAIANVQAKKKHLEKEKGLLDIADSNTLLLHPTQFTITQPASPGGPHNNRKTRHTRHRLDVENPEANGESSKRKRKVPADFDNVSPGPATRGPNMTDSLYHWDRGYTLLDHQHAATPVLSIDSLFSSKELQLYLRQSIEVTGQSWAKRSRTHPSGSKFVVASGQGTNGNTSPMHDTQYLADQASEEEADQDVPATLAAPMMERGGSYATRSTRKDETAHLYDAFDGTRQEALRCFGLAAVGAHIKMLRTRDEIPLTAPLSAQEILDDVAIFETVKATDTY